MNKQLASLAAATLIGAAAGLIASSPAPASGIDPEACAPIKASKVTYVDAAGNAAPAWLRGRGAVAQYRDADGTERTATILPPGLDAQTASPKARAALHLPATSNDPKTIRLISSLRPSPNTGKAPEIPTLCHTLRHNANSSNWSGRVTTQWGNITQVGGTFYVPTYSAVCAHASAHSTWVGFGGWNSGSRV